MNLKKYREMHKFTMQELAQKLCINYKVYNRYELEQVPIPIERAIQLADIYGITLDELVCRTVPKK